MRSLSITLLLAALAGSALAQSEPAPQAARTIDAANRPPVTKNLETISEAPF